MSVWIWFKQKQNNNKPTAWSWFAFLSRRRSCVWKLEYRRWKQKEMLFYFSCRCKKLSGRGGNEAQREPWWRKTGPQTYMASVKTFDCGRGRLWPVLFRRYVHLHSPTQAMVTVCYLATGFLYYFCSCCLYGDWKPSLVPSGFCKMHFNPGV